LECVAPGGEFSFYFAFDHFCSNHFACFDFQIENNNFCFSQTKHCHKHKDHLSETHMEIVVHKTRVDHGNLGMVTYHHV